MKSEMFLVEELEIQRMAKEVLAHQNFDEGDADADIPQLKLRKQFAAKDKTIEAGMGFALVGIHQRQFGDVPVMSRQSAAVDDKSIVAAANKIGDRFIKMRLHRNIQVGVNQVFCLRIFIQPLKNVGDQRQGWEGGVLPNIADASL